MAWLHLFWDIKISLISNRSLHLYYTIVLRKTGCMKYLKGIRKILHFYLILVYCEMLFLSTLSFSHFQGFVSTYWKENCIFFCIFSFLPQKSTFKYNVCVVFTQKTFRLSLKLLLKALLQEGLETLDQMHFTSYIQKYTAH